MNPVYGSVAWAKSGGGRMSTRERRRETVRGALSYIASRALRAGRALGLAPREFELALRDVKIPETPIARAAEEALSTAPSWVIGHSMRTYVWGAILATRDGVAHDAEIAYAASLLHDLGLVVAEGEACFAHRGAELARAIVKSAGGSQEIGAHIADAIALHLNVTPSGAPEALVVRWGAGYDVVGERFEHIAPATRREVLIAWPRMGFAEEVTKSLQAEAQAHPGTRVGFMCETLRFGGLIRAAERRFSKVA
jgi:hypothetical protein